MIVFVFIVQDLYDIHNLFQCMIVFVFIVQDLYDICLLSLWNFIWMTSNGRWMVLSSTGIN